MAKSKHRVRRLAAHVTAGQSRGGGAGPAEVYILAARRTPIGSASGALSEFTAVELGAAAIQGAIQAAGVPPEGVQECIMGNVLSAGLGQAPARQAATAAGLPVATCCTTVNKVCASGLKAVTLAAQSIALGQAELVVAGGMESMSNVPYYVGGQARAGRGGFRYGDQRLSDGVARDGLSDPWRGEAMGVYGDLCAREQGITREEQDAFAACSYERARAACAQGGFAREIVPITPKARGKRVAVAATVSTDEEVEKGRAASELAALRPAFSEGGTVTAASSSKISDGAAAVVLASGARVARESWQPVARVVAYADAEREPERFTTAPALAIERALSAAALRVEDIDAFEINEAFAVVVLANTKLLGLDEKRVNVHGGACALGHPIGCSGARIVATLCTVLEARGGQYGVAAVCNGGGGATALVLERC